MRYYTSDATNYETARAFIRSREAYGQIPARYHGKTDAAFDAAFAAGDELAANSTITRDAEAWRTEQAARALLDWIDDAQATIGDGRTNHEDLKALARAGETAIRGAIAGLEDDAEFMADFSAQIGLQVGVVAVADTPEGIAARLKAAEFLRRGLSVRHGRLLEQAKREAGAVSRYAGLYVSDATLAARRAQKARNRALLATLKAVNELGQEFGMDEIAEKGMANGENRRAELMTRIAGFEAIAIECGHAGEFYTLTTPSRFHPMAKGGANPKYEGATPRDAQQYLTRQWAKIRAALHRRGIDMYGFRVAEPHHDGTPHWHMMLFMRPEHTKAVRAIMRKYALQIDGDEAGAEKHRFTAVAIDWSRGTAAGYIAKYIAKNIDGKTAAGDSIGEDFEGTGGTDATEGAERVDAWAGVWGIRQFQQIGNAPVSVWRELRRLGVVEGEGDDARRVFPHLDGLIADAATAADGGDWAAFCRLLGGPLVKRVDLPMALLKVEKLEPNRYGELGAKVVKGVRAVDGGEAISRIHEWKIERAQPAQGKSEARAAWTGVNNCTPGQIEHRAISALWAGDTWLDRANRLIHAPPTIN